MEGLPMTYTYVRTRLDFGELIVTVDYVRERHPLYPFHSDRCTVMDMSLDPNDIKALTVAQVEDVLLIAKRLVEGPC